ncbi:hypothetical protein H1R20_g10931, partial [Candolleomyces eurysporus]
MGRDSLYVDLDWPSSTATDSSQSTSKVKKTKIRIGNTHLESLAGRGDRVRPNQVESISSFLSCQGISGGLVGGDMNAISPSDAQLAEKNGLSDAWIMLRKSGSKGEEEAEEGKVQADESLGHTWGHQPPTVFPPGRLDKVLFNGCLKVESMERIGLVDESLEKTLARFKKPADIPDIHKVERAYVPAFLTPEWLQGCYEWAIEEPGVGPVPPYPPKLFELIEDQLLKSNLSESMDLETGLPHDIGDFNKTLTLPATSTLVEITSLTEIGHSAFQLDQIRKAREERIQAGLDEYGEGEEDADIEIEGEGPMPKYPRGMLSFVLSDGKTSFKACEYRTLPDLSLVRTPLGFKMHLKNVRVVRGVAHLEPKNVTLLGGHSDLQALTSYHFRQNLRQRMNLPPEPMPEQADENAAGAIPPPPPPAGAPPV